MRKPTDFRVLIPLLFLLFSVAISAKADPLAPVCTGDTLHLKPIKDTDPGHGNRKPGEHIYAFVEHSGLEMLLHFSEPVSCEIQLVDMDGQVALIARMRDEDIAILDVSRLHGRFQLIIRSDHWLATKAYWFP